MRHRFEFLDGVRGLAALSVAFGHFFALFYIIPPYPHVHHLLEKVMTAPLIRVLFNGEICVCIFFVLSGFVLSYKFFLPEPVNVGLTVSKRYFRLAGPVVVSVLISCLLMKLGLFRNVQAASISGDTWTASFFQFVPHFTTAIKQGLYDVFAGPNTPAVWFNPVLWTMKIELLGSLIVFGAASILGKTRGSSFIYLLLALTFWKSYYLCFIVGILFAHLYTRGKLRTLKLHPALQGLAVLVLAAVLVGLDEYNSKTGLPFEARLTGTTFIATLTATAIILTSILVPALQRVLSTRPVRFLGKVSFALYIIHFVTYATFSSALYIAFNNMGLNPAQNFGATFVVSVPVILYLSYLYTKYIDVPAIHFSNKIGQFLSEPFTKDSLHVPTRIVTSLRPRRAR